MQTEIIKIRDQDDFVLLERAGEVIRSSGLVAFPTETVYGLGGNALDPEASAKIYRAKGRPSDNPLIVHLSDPDEAGLYCETGELYYILASRFMPGPLTVILKKKKSNGRFIIPDETTGGLDSAAVRCPSDPIAHSLIRFAGVPVAAPSANRSGSPSPTTAEHVKNDLYGRIDMIIDGGPCNFGLESTVVKIDGDSLTILRPGAVTAEDLEPYCSSVTVSDAESKPGEVPLSPGMKYRHYSPSKRFYLVNGEDSDVIGFFMDRQKSENCALIVCSEDASVLEDRNLFILGSRNNKFSQAHSLFGCLREADASDADVIYARLPDRSGIGLALFNRLIRACGHNVINL